MIEPIATTVATLDPQTSANIAHATTPASARPPCQWPISEVAKAIIRRATPPWVRKFPARMKNGIAMISNFSMPVKSFNATDWIGTEVIANRYVSTVSPSEIEIGMPVSIRPNSSAKMIQALATSAPASLSTPGIAISTGGISAGQRGCPTGAGAGMAVVIAPPPLRPHWPTHWPTHLPILPLRCHRRSRVSLLDRRRMEIWRGEAAGGGLADPLDVRDVVVWQLAGTRERPRDLQ